MHSDSITKGILGWGFVLGIVAGLGGGAASGCGDSESPSGSQGTGANGGSTGSGGGSDGGFHPSGSGGSGGSGGGGADCGGVTSVAKPIPLDIYLMLDKSGSMDDDAAGGVTKWQAVTQALAAFFGDTDSAGIGVGIQFFPTPPPGVPGSCTTDPECGTGGPCVFNICTGVSVLTPCTNPGDCTSPSQCVQLGHCANDTNPTSICAPAGSDCGGALGLCEALTTSFCAGQDSCNLADYQAPAVEIAPLNGAAGTLNAAIGAEAPSGATPTSPAIGGAIAHAQTWAVANPTHAVVAVLATDGLPTECAPTDIDSIAQIAASGVSGSPSVPTYVIGVFNATDTASLANLNQIAQAGGTNQAFVVDPSQDVEQQFLDAMNAIRGTKLACEYLVPAPTDGGDQDFGKVNVEFTAPDATDSTTIPYVGSKANCDPTDGGWYYDEDPDQGGTPTKIIMCPATCTLFSQGGSIKIRVGCKTVIVPA